MDISNIGNESLPQKTTVHYKNLWSKPTVGYSVILTPLDHPSDLVSNTKPVCTSPVVSYDKETGVIETRNTVYVPEEL